MNITSAFIFLILIASCSDRRSIDCGKSDNSVYCDKEKALSPAGGASAEEYLGIVRGIESQSPYFKIHNYRLNGGSAEITRFLDTMVGSIESSKIFSEVSGNETGNIKCTSWVKPAIAGIRGCTEGVIQFRLELDSIKVTIRFAKTRLYEVYRDGHLYGYMTSVKFDYLAAESEQERGSFEQGRNYLTSISDTPFKSKTFQIVDEMYQAQLPTEISGQPVTYLLPKYTGEFEAPVTQLFFPYVNPDGEKSELILEVRK